MIKCEIPKIREYLWVYRIHTSALDNPETCTTIFIHIQFHSAMERASWYIRWAMQCKLLLWKNAKLSVLNFHSFFEFEYSGEEEGKP